VPWVAEKHRAEKEKKEAFRVPFRRQQNKPNQPLNHSLLQGVCVQMQVQASVCVQVAGVCTEPRMSYSDVACTNSTNHEALLTRPSNATVFCCSHPGLSCLLCAFVISTSSQPKRRARKATLDVQRGFSRLTLTP